jgi:hypothetical protein
MEYWARSNAGPAQPEVESKKEKSIKPQASSIKPQASRNEHN